jgi:hypothetical protein
VPGAPGRLPGPPRTAHYIQLNTNALNFTSDLPIAIHCDHGDTLDNGVMVTGYNQGDWERLLAEDYSRPPAVSDAANMDDTLYLGELVEPLGFDSIWSSEAYGSDCFTPLAWWGSATERVKLGTAITQISARTPASTAMTAITLDHLSGGRVILGLGVSGPQVVEGWYGQSIDKPLAEIGGEPMIVHVWRRACEAGIGPVPMIAGFTPATAEERSLPATGSPSSEALPEDGRASMCRAGLAERGRSRVARVSGGDPRPGIAAPADRRR